MATHGSLPHRTNTVSTQNTGYTSDDDAVPTNDPSSTLGLLEERLQAWKHMTAYLEDYAKAVAKDQHSQSKDSEKILKTLNHPLKEGHHFDQSLGGVAGLFENLRANTQAQSQLYAETEKNLTGNVLPILERLHKEIKSKRKELDAGAGKQSKAVDHARNSSQKHIEMLGQHTATFDSTGGKTTAANDPYVLQRGVWHRLNKQLAEENNHRSDLINIQNNFQQFENHVINTVQNFFNTFNSIMANQADRSKAMYGDVAKTAGGIDPNFEWNGFAKRNGHVLISPNSPARTIDTVSFPNQGHRATKALIEGSLERKSKMGALGGHKANYYAVTPAGYMHEYKDNDNFRSDPVPEHSLYLPDCVIGAVDGQKFTIKGKDSSGSKFTQKLSMSSEYTYLAHTPGDAQQWHSVIASVCAGTTNSLPNSPTSPTDMQNQIPSNLNTTAAQQQSGTTGTGMQQQQPGVAGHDMASPTSAGGAGYGSQPSSATGAAPPAFQQQTGTLPQSATHPDAKY
ncbi:hypothetical protein PMZ80_000074 [Knufia obscura]|uniref:PH domain-containing protein n=1 Tax=Knufia obscura TaxID=1635080 RepID=A0ABR0S096_9EURO|nr:hypothetical protein PMZ80_000074 [Knufia obscura]